MLNWRILQNAAPARVETVKKIERLFSVHDSFFMNSSTKTGALFFYCPLQYNSTMTMLFIKEKP